MTMHAPAVLPSWMAPSPVATTDPAPLTDEQRRELARLKRENENTLFDNAFEGLLDQVRAGNPLSAAVDMDPRPIDYARLLVWIRSDETRLSRFNEAKEIGAEVVEDQMLTIADASDTMEDVQRSTLRINTRKWLLGVWNRKRYGDTRQQETTININIQDAMAAAQARVDARRTIDVQARSIK